MSDTKETRRPTHVVWQVLGEGGKSRWTRIGAGWPNRDGRGLSLKFDACPLAGRTVVREAGDADDPGSNAA